MRIGIDVTSASGPPSGVGNYTMNLVRHLLQTEQRHRFVLLHYSWGYRFNSSMLPEGWDKKAAVRSLRVPTRLLIKAWSSLRFPPLEYLAGNFDIFHHADFVHAPQLRGKAVTTVHDLIALKLSDLMEPRIRAAQFDRAKKLILDKPCRVIAVSECTKEDVVSLLGIPAESVRVVHEAPCMEVGDGRGCPTFEDAAGYFGIKQPYILYVGAIEYRKNLSRLIEAYAGLRRRDSSHILVLAGALGWRHREVLDKAKELGVEEHVIFTGSVSRQYLPLLLKGASLFVYPSLYEGFGLPALEAMSCGIPVIASNTSSLPEVVGSAGILINPCSVDEIQEAMWDVISSEALQDELKQKGLQRAANFTWERVARETLAVYEELL